MMKMLGIPLGFDSPKGKPVAGNDVSGVRAVTKRQPRQYMNRRGGFVQKPVSVVGGLLLQMASEKVSTNCPARLAGSSIKVST
ncbi:hypothetical protein MUK42_33191 [Musa troglodytarum]|uniref:U4/U6.U5 small nuclear ribonucleoprotein 27kDa protein domain-containing protein n=1 Tax=Musa troglodytarum TaxID=320322 RepID=A0A9E7FEX1_9LILI|nr:hypothetical protein MUK42_33191 [Musa troglodytarum]